MSLLKKTWNDLITEHVTALSNMCLPLYDLLSNIDEKFYAKISEGTSPLYLSELLPYISENFFTPNNSLWDEMPIYVSSYKFSDKRIINEISVRLLQYIGFYNKILTDDGVAREVVTHRTFASEGDNSGDYKNYESETPQIGLTNFDEAINYASRLEKNEDSRHTEKSGSSDYELKSFNWDEALRNMKLVFYDDLVRYINRIPELIYNYYSTDEIPVGESIKGYFDMLKDLRDIHAR